MSMSILKFIFSLFFALGAGHCLLMALFHQMVKGNLKMELTPMSDIVKSARGGRELPDSWLKPMHPSEKGYRELPKTRCPKSMCPHLYK